MTTIEMINELIKNGGTFESFIDGCFAIDYCKLTENGVEFLYKDTDKPHGVISLCDETLKSKWKPYIKRVDWSKVPVDTKVLCKGANSNKWYKRHFAKTVNGLPAVWDSGCTSHSAPDDCVAWFWEEVKLAEE